MIRAIDVSSITTSGREGNHDSDDQTGNLVRLGRPASVCAKHLQQSDYTRRFSGQTKKQSYSDCLSVECDAAHLCG